MTDRIAILGWGSLLWHPDAMFDAHHEPWQMDGPELKIEFSRVSQTRAGALTLVIDPYHGAINKVAYCLSNRATVDQAIEDLRVREGTPTQRTIGFVHGSDEYRCCDPHSLDAIRSWAAQRKIAGVVWTDLPSNFAQLTRRSFSIDSARAYLHSLDEDGKARAREYLRNAPSFIQTPLRSALTDFLP